MQDVQFGSLVAMPGLVCTQDHHKGLYMIPRIHSASLWNQGVGGCSIFWSFVMPRADDPHGPEPHVTHGYTSCRFFVQLKALGLAHKVSTFPAD